MSSRSWQLRIQDILERIDSITELVSGLSLADLKQDRILAKAILYDLLVIGEASAKVEIAIQSKYQQIPWREIADVRNKIIHEYFRVSLEIAWDTIENDLPILQKQLQELLEN
jgi:uncharacterized protein with HEPN domain